MKGKGQKEKIVLGAAGVVLLAGLVAAFWLFPKRPASPPERPAKGAAPAQTFFPKGRGKIAIVLDDWGYNRNQLGILAQIDAPLTVAILPGLPYSAAAVSSARAAGHEVILHMPMEAQGPHVAREKGTIGPSQTAGEIGQLLEESLASVPYAQGFSNHQGSKATADFPFMEVVLREAKRRNLYFVDSVVTDQSVCERVARKLQVRYARRNVFLDNDPTAQSIRKSLTDLARYAARHGQAVAIGHDRFSTLRVLQTALPELEKAGYTLVFASDLAQVP